MRELKFRAWDLKENKWRYHYEEIGGFNIQGELILFGEFGSDLPLERFLNDVVIQQYTGLKDKNGVEIYEGDVVMFLDRDWADYEKDTKRFPVVYENDGFVLKDTTENKYGEFYTYALHKDFGRDRFEVIGNIYQHLHLLKA